MTMFYNCLKKLLSTVDQKTKEMLPRKCMHIGHLEMKLVLVMV